MDTDGATETEALGALLVLQDADLHTDQLRHHQRTLPERARVADIELEIATLRRTLAGVESQRDVLEARAAEIETEVQTVRGRRAAIDQRLSSTAAGSFRDQEAMANELGSLTERMIALEDDELALLEQTEPLEAEIRRLEDAIAVLDNDEAEARAELRRAEEILEEEIVTANLGRAALAAAVPGALLSEYEQLRARLDGIGAARLEHGMCSGCRLVIPATDLDRMRHGAPGAVFHCDQCGRILIAT